jgi:hypothetical protein
MGLMVKKPFESKSKIRITFKILLEGKAVRIKADNDNIPEVKTEPSKIPQ